MRKILKNKPLVEAIFELHWELQGKAPSGEDIDPHYRKFLTQIEDRVLKDYPEYKALSTVDVPDKFIPHKIQHQFWAAENTWPIIQVGPGIVALNETIGYDWIDFKERLSYLVGLIHDTHPDAKDLKLNRLSLRYINAIEFNYDERDVFEFLREKMGVCIDVTRSLLWHPEITCPPSHLILSISLPSTRPVGIMDFAVKRGKRQEKDVLFWELGSYALDDHAPDMAKEAVVNWADEAHSTISELFSKLIEGDLLKEFE